MATSYPDRTNARGVWKLSDITKNIKTEGTFPRGGEGGRGIWAGGQTPSNVNTIDYVTIATTGNATDFGDLTAPYQSMGALADLTRGIFSTANDRGTGDSYGGGRTSIMDYIAIASTGNAQNFGSLSQERQGGAGVCDGTLGIFSCADSGNNTNRVDQVTVQTTGNATTWGELTIHRHHFGGQCAWDQT